MPVIAVSSDSPEVEASIAEKIAQQLGYTLLGRALLEQVARQHKVKPEELVQALDEPLALMARRNRRRKELVTHIQAACLEALQSDEVVCHGLAAHLYVVGISHAMRVRVLANPERRAEELAGPGPLTPEKARRLLARDQQGRSRWSQELFGVDETDPSSYDIVLSLTNLEPEQAARIVCEAADFPKFQAMTYSRKCLEDFTLASRVRQALMHRFPDVQVRVSDGTVVVQVQSLKRDRRRKQEAVRELAGQVPGVRYVEVHVINDLFGQAMISDR